MKAFYQSISLFFAIISLFIPPAHAGNNLLPCDNSTVMSNAPLLICSDGTADIISPMNDIGGLVGTDYAYVVTDDLDSILLWNPNAATYDFDPLASGTYHIYGMSYQGNLTIAMDSMLTDITSDDCVTLSDNFIEVQVSELPTPSDAGEDIYLCDTFSTTLNGNMPTIGVGEWTQLSGPNTATVDMSTSDTTLLDNLIIGTYVFAWTISTGGACPASVSTVNVLVINDPTTADAGTDQVLCQADSTAMAANIPALNESGLWTQIDGNMANIVNPDAYNTDITGLMGGAYTFEWQIFNDSCQAQASRDTVLINVWNAPTMAEAGLDIDVCEGESVEMGANTPGFSEQGIWTELTGLGASIQNPTNPSTTVTFPSPGLYELEWALSNPGCTDADTVIINVLESPVITTLSIDSPTTIGGSDGGLLCCINFGTAPYTVLSNPPLGIFTGTSSVGCDSTFMVDDLPVGSYDFLITDANGCTGTISTTIPDFQCDFALDTITATAETCFEDNDGTITVSLTDGTGPYTYAIGQNTAINPSPTATFGPLSAGTYTVTVTDNSGCVVTGSTSITQPDSLYVIAMATGETQLGADDGTIDICVEGGLAGYTLTLTPNFPIVSTLGACSANYFVSNLPADTYTINVEDANGCTVSTTAVVSPGNCITAIDAVNIDAMVSCHGAADGQLTISASGTNDFQYSIDNGATYTASTGNPTFTYMDLPAGNYNVVIMDDLGCVYAYTNNPVVITQPLDFFPTAMGTDATMPGGSDGFIDLCVNGAVPPYTATYEAAAGATGAFTSSSGVCAGNFTANGLPAGEYDLYITDDSGCMDTLFNIIINDLDCSNFNIDNVIASNVACNGGNTGSITVQTSGGFAPFSYIIDDGIMPDTVFMENGATYTFTGLEAGTYSISAIHSDACPLTYSMNPITVNEPPALNAAIDTQNPTAIGATDGQICITPSGGTAPYTITASCGTAQAGGGACGGVFYIDNLGAGNCNLQISDANNCLYTISVTLADPSCAGFTLVNVEQTNVSCEGESDGTITITVNGGSAPYEYSIDGGSTTTSDNSSMFTFAGVDTGNYTVQIIDGQGCLIDAPNSVMITEPTALMVSAVVDSTCVDAEQGQINLSVSGATSPYMYFWSTGSTTQDINQLAAGSYEVTVTDSNACTEELNFTVPTYEEVFVNAGMDVSITSDESTQLNGTIMTNQNYTFSWSPNAGLSDPNSLTPTAQPSGSVTYTLTVIPDNGCVTSDEVVVTVESVRQLVGLPNAFTPNGDSDNDILFPQVQGGATLLSFYVFNRWGQRIHDDELSGWDGTFKGEAQPVGTYVYVLKYMNSEGGEEVASGDVTLLR